MSTLFDLHQERRQAAESGDMYGYMRAARDIDVHVADTRPTYRLGSDDAKLAALLDEAAVPDCGDEGWLTLPERVALLIEQRDDAVNTADTYRAERDDLRHALHQGAA